MPVRFLEHYRKADRIMLALIWLMLLFSLGLAFWHDTLLQALFIGGGTSVVLTLAYRVISGTRLMRCALSVGLMVMAALHINQAQGVIESHFGIFALLVVLTFYRDWLLSLWPPSPSRCITWCSMRCSIRVSRCL